MFYTNKPKTIKKVTEPEYWDKKLPDYKTVQNLLKGLKQHIVCGEDKRLGLDTMNTPASSGLMTDGVIPADCNYNSGEWFKFARAEYREIVYDLGKTSAVSGFKGWFLYDQLAGVYLPRDWQMAVSENGHDWEIVYEDKGFFAETPKEICVLEKTIAKHCARFVRFRFNIDMWVMIGELEVTGTKEVPKSAKPVVPGKGVKKKKIVDYKKYLMPDEFFGIRDLMLAYNCCPPIPERGSLTVDMLKPYVAYYDRAGKMKDFFFDSFLFLPFAAFPMRNADTNADTWRMYVDNTFEHGKNTDALDFTVGEAKEELKRPDYKVKVFLSILYPFKIQRQFGDLYGNGEKLDFANFEDRKKAIKWIIDTQLWLFKERNYTNIELSGFYWFEEQISLTDGGEKEMIQWTTDYVRSLGYKTIWIPYYHACGFDRWRDYGIDFACMQPNYAFHEETIDVIYDTAEICKKEHMCVEMEIGGSSDVHIKRYNDYMRVGVETGYMEAVHMYYQGGGPGEFYQAYASDDPALNDLYHHAYQFAKHTLKADFDKNDKKKK